MGLLVCKVEYFKCLSAEKNPQNTDAAISVFFFFCCFVFCNWLRFLIDFRFADFLMIRISTFALYMSTCI